MTDTSVPARCPNCGRISVDNKWHCNGKDMTPSKWAKRCTWMTCIGSAVVDGKTVHCGTVYAAVGYYPRRGL